jgi:hypothetical protein
MEMLDQIDAIERNLYRYEIAKAGKLLTDTVTHLAAMPGGLSAEKTKTFNAILEYLNLGMQNGDYLFVADVLHYELKPFLRQSLS